MIPFGSQIAGAVFVGKSMGEGSAKKAKTYMKLIVGYTFVVMTILAVFLYIFRMNVSLIFTDQEELLNLTSDNFRLIAVFMVVHGIGMSIGGALRGMGKQSTATKMVFLGFYLVGHPMSALCAFYFNLGLSGLLIGFICGSFTMGLLFYFALTVSIDW